MTSTSPIVTEILTWRGLLIEIRYEPQWHGTRYTAHLQLETLEPARAPLPVTETGYRSHFLPCGAIEEAGGPSDYVLAWLELAAKDQQWIAAQAAARQYALF